VAQTAKKARELLLQTRGLKVGDKRVKTLLAEMGAQSPPGGAPAPAAAAEPAVAAPAAAAPAPAPAATAAEPAPVRKYAGRGGTIAAATDASSDQEVKEGLRRCREEWSKTASFKMKHAFLEKEGIVCSKTRLKKIIAEEASSPTAGTEAGESAGDGSVGAASAAGPDRDAVLTFQSPAQTALALQQAGTFKEAGAAAFKVGNFALCIEEWSAGIEALRCCPAEPEVEALRLALFNNRAFAHSKKGTDLRAVEADVAEVLLRDPANVKAIFRRAQARASLLEWEGAVTDLNKVLELQPSNKVRKRAF
jgi:hypothetical protein